MTHVNTITNAQTCGYTSITIVSFEICTHIKKKNKKKNYPFSLLPSPHVRCNPRLVSRPRAQQDLLPPADEFMLLETSEGDGWKEQRSDLRARDRSVHSRSASCVPRRRAGSSSSSGRGASSRKDARRKMCGAPHQPQRGNLGWKHRGTLKPSLDRA